MEETGFQPKSRPGVGGISWRSYATARVRPWWLRTNIMTIKNGKRKRITRLAVAHPSRYFFHHTRFHPRRAWDPSCEPHE